MTALGPRAVEARHVDVLVDFARTHFRGAPLKGAALADEIRRVSGLYNAGEAPAPGDVGALCARLRFFLPRDLPKLEGPLAELERAGAFPRREVLRVLDLGAGLGTSTLALARFAARVEGVTRIEVDAVDRDAAALDVAAGLCERAGDLGGVPVTLRAVAADLSDLDAARLEPPYDVVLQGLVVSELGEEEADEVRVAASQLERLERMRPWLAPDAVVITLEPGLRTTSRVLQRMRDVLAETPGGLHVFAPCVRSGACPMLLRGRDWCHASMPLGLPEPVAALARAAGLRERELTYSYLTLHGQARGLREVAAVPLLRVVGGPLRSKGKIEVHVCGEAAVGRLRVLGRHVQQGDRTVRELRRGDLLSLGGGITERGDTWVLGPETTVTVAK